MVRVAWGNLIGFAVAIWFFMNPKYSHYAPLLAVFLTGIMLGYLIGRNEKDNR